MTFCGGYWLDPLDRRLVRLEGGGGLTEVVEALSLPQLIETIVCWSRSVKYQQWKTPGTARYSSVRLHGEFRVQWHKGKD